MLGIWRWDETKDNSWLDSVPCDMVKAKEGCEGVVPNARYWGQNLFAWCAQSTLTELVINFIICIHKFCIYKLCISLRWIYVCVYVKELIRACQNECYVKAMKASRTKKSIGDKYVGNSCLRDPCSWCFVRFHSQWDAWTEVLVK